MIVCLHTRSSYWFEVTALTNNQYCRAYNPNLFNRLGDVTCSVNHNSTLGMIPIQTFLKALSFSFPESHWLCVWSWNWLGRGEFTVIVLQNDNIVSLYPIAVCGTMSSNPYVQPATLDKCSIGVRIQKYDWIWVDLSFSWNFILTHCCHDLWNTIRIM